MLVQELVVLGNVPVVEVGNAEIEKDIEKEGEIQEVKIETIIHDPRDDLNIPVNCKNPDRFDQKIQSKQQSEVCQKFPLHIKKVKSFREQKLFMETSKK
jgi:hypothetical protein